MTSLIRRSLFLTLCICSSCAHRAPAPPVAPPLPPIGAYSVSKVLHVGGEGRWDYVTIDPRTRLLYLPRQTHVMTVLASTGEITGEVADTPGVHGVALVPELHRAFASNGTGNSVSVFDQDSGRPLGTIAAGDKPDAILYDPASARVLVFNGKSQDVTVINPSEDPKFSITSRIPLDGTPEFAVTDCQGRVYVNLENRNSVEVIDTRFMQVVAEWSIVGGAAPTGLAIDVAHHRLFSGCRNQVMAVLDTETGKTLATLPIGKGVDACAFDPVTRLAFASCSDGTLTVARESSPGTFEVTQTVPTRKGARTMALDPLTHTVYLATAEFPQTAPAKGRPEPKPDSFMIVVVSRGH